MLLFLAPAGISGSYKPKPSDNNKYENDWKGWLKYYLSWFLKGFAFAGSIFILFEYIYIFYTFLFLSPFFKIEEVNVSKVSPKLQAETISCAEQYKNSLGNLVLFPSSKVEKILSQNPRIKDVKIEKKFPHEISLMIEERKAYALIAQNDWIYSVDSDGCVIGQADMQELKRNDFLFFTGRFNEQIIPGKKILNPVFYSAKRLAQTLKELSPSLYNDISEIHLTLEGDIYLYLIYGTEIRFDGNPSSVKLARLEAFADQIGSLDKVVYVDFRFDKQIPYVLKSNDGI